MAQQTVEETIQQKTSLTGTGNIALALGKVSGDVHIGDVQVVSDNQFFDLVLAELRVEPPFESPAADELVEILARERLLILAGSLANKTECARDLAYRLGQRLTAGEPSQLAIRERWRGQAAQRLEGALGGDGPTILLLPEISKSQLAAYGPVKMLKLLSARNAYVIITTDGSRESWHVAEGGYHPQLWHDLSPETYYGYPQLAAFLLRLLVDSELPVAEGLLPDLSESGHLVAGVPLLAAAESLKSPENVRFFARGLLASVTVPSRKDIEEKLAELAGDPEGVLQWYDQLDSRDQLLAVGLVLFDGLPDDLLFAGLELLVETTWRGSDPLLPQFDYCDLSRFETYFKERHVEGGFVRIESGSRERRRQILSAAWRHQRRRLLATLPALTEMIRESAADAAAQSQPMSPNRSAPVAAVKDSPASSASRSSGIAGSAARALGRSESGSTQLHQVLVESLSMIGLLSIEMVEPYLLDLAADPSESVQHLVAGALAAWRGEDGWDRTLFKLLQQWWLEAVNVGDSNSRIARAARLGPDPWGAVRAAVALAVGHAAQYDREGYLAQALTDLLNQLLIDANPRVRDVVGRFTLPHIITWHFRELESLIRTRALAAQDLIPAVARGAARACEIGPEACLPILDSWTTLARAEAKHDDQYVRSREILLATVALTWGFIHCDDEQPRLSGATMASKLLALIQDEKHPFIRHYALAAIEIQTQRNFALAAGLLQALLESIGLAERPAMIDLSVRVYLFQRQQLRGGDRNVVVNGHSYPIWTRSPRPLTGLEASLYGWILDDTRPAAQQLAVGIFAALSDTALDREEERLRASVPGATKLASDAAAALSGGRQAAARRLRLPDTRDLPLLGHLAVYLAEPRKPALRSILKPLLAEMLFVWSRVQQTAALPPPRSASEAAGATARRHAVVAPATTADRRLDVLLKRWMNVRNEATRAIAAHLRRALRFYRWRWGLVLAAVVLILGIVSSGLAGWDAWQRYRGAVAPPASVRPPASAHAPAG